MEISAITDLMAMGANKDLMAIGAMEDQMAISTIIGVHKVNQRFDH